MKIFSVFILFCFKLLYIFVQTQFIILRAGSWCCPQQSLWRGVGWFLTCPVPRSNPQHVNVVHKARNVCLPVCLQQPCPLPFHWGKSPKSSSHKQGFISELGADSPGFPCQTRARLSSHPPTHAARSLPSSCISAGLISADRDVLFRKPRKLPQAGISENKKD